MVLDEEFCRILVELRETLHDTGGAETCLGIVVPALLHSIAKYTETLFINVID